MHNAGNSGSSVLLFRHVFLLCNGVYARKRQKLATAYCKSMGHARQRVNLPCLCLTNDIVYLPGPGHRIFLFCV